MKIGIDLSPLQGAHRMRGIGFALLNFINNISIEDRKKHAFVFFISPPGATRFGDPLKLLDLKGIKYDVRLINSSEQQRNSKLNAIGKLLYLITKSRQHMQRTLPIIIQRQLNRLGSAYRSLRAFYFGDSRKQDLSDIDVYLQPDQSFNLPVKHGLKKVLIIYDIIPYVLDNDYLLSYHVARQRGYTFKGSIRLGINRWLYAYKLKINVRRSSLSLAISQHTKDDFVKYLGLSDKKISVTPLGVLPPKYNTGNDPDLKRYLNTFWGYIPRSYRLPGSTPFLLFVGGADRRRRINDLVTAFNHLRAEGHDIKLVLSGDIMQGPNNIPTEETQEALNSSSYLDDIIFVGFTDDTTRDWLYRHALAFVYPSKYEGFGLPILEAMSYGCPVICYDNPAVREVGGDAPMYAQNADDIKNFITKILESPSEIERLRNKGVSQAKQFSWSKTAKQMLQAIEKA